MKKRVISAVLCLSMLAGSLCLEPVAQAAKKPRLNKTKVTLSVGKSYRLKVSNYKGKVSWKTSKKTVAVVSSKGKVSAKGKGIAKVTARLVRLKKNLSCKVTVRDNKKQMTDAPVISPANQSTLAPTNVQNTQPSKEPVPTATQKAEVIVTATPEVSESTNEPEETQVPNPTDKPIFGPTNKPTEAPTTTPTDKPILGPTNKPTEAPTKTPEDKPILGPTNKPTEAPSPTATPGATASPEPTATAIPTASPDVTEYYSAPYSLTFGSDTVKTSGDGASYVVNDDGSVTISVSKQYQGISFELPDTLEDANFDTVTITYKDAVNVGGGYGCGIWRIPTDKATEDVVAWGGVFADTDSGSRVFTSAGKSDANAWKITKCLLFHNEAEHNMTPSAQVTITSLVFSHSKYDSSLPTPTPKPTVTTKPTATPAPTPRPQTTPGATAKPSEDGGLITENYEYASDYTLGWNNGIVAYQNGTKKSLEEVGVTVYSKESDRPFMADKLQGWNNSKLILTQPVKYTTSDGKAHDVESMLTNFDFIADPTAIDNSDVDGKLYVYGTTEGFSYEDGTLVNNKYSNHSLTILSTTDMVNWTDEGFMDTQNLTNLPSDAANKVKSGYTGGNTWAPSGLKIDGDGDRKDEFYLFYTNGGSVGYVMADSPTGPWKDPLNKELCGKSLPNCDDCYICFDPGVLADDKGNAYVYFGGLSRTSGRVVKIRFEEGSGEVVIDGEPIRLSTHAFFEDNVNIHFICCCF